MKVHGVEPGETNTYAEEYRYIAFALSLMPENKSEEAYRLLWQLYHMAGAQNRVGRIIEIKFCLSNNLAVTKKVRANRTQ